MVRRRAGCNSLGYVNGCLFGCSHGIFQDFGEGLEVENLYAGIELLAVDFVYPRNTPNNALLTIRGLTLNAEINNSTFMPGTNEVALNIDPTSYQELGLVTSTHFDYDSGTVCTFDAAANLVLSPSHGLSDGIMHISRTMLRVFIR